MSVGLLTGSLLGAIAGFGIGLFVDMVLVQTLGVTSLLYIAIGYWSGRLRELRDPAHGLVPLALGAAATAFAGIGMALIQFLLGVDAPVSLLLLQQIFITVLVNTLIALPVYALVRRIIQPALPRGSAPPPPPRLHDRRPQPAAAPVRAPRPDPPLGVAMIQLPEDRRPPLTPQLALRVAIARQLRAGDVRDHLLPPVVPAGALRRPVPRAGERQPGARRRDPRPARRDPRPQRQRPRRLQAGDRGADLAARPAAQPGARAARPVSTGWPRVLGISTKRPMRCRGAPATASTRLAPIPCAVAQQLALLPYANVTLKTDVPNDVHYYLAERQDQFPGVQRPAGLAAPLPARTTSPRSCSAPSGRSPPQELKRAPLPRRLAAARSSASRASSGTTTATCAATTAPTRSRSTRSGASRATCRRQADRRPHAQALARPRPAEGRPAGAGRRRSRATRRRTAGAFVALNPVNGEVYAMGSYPTFDPNIFTKPVPRVGVQAAQQRRQRLPAVQPGDPERVPHGVDVQGHHRDRGAAERRLEPRRAPTTTPASTRTARATRATTPATPSYGVLDLTQAIQVSSDNFFYNLGRLLNSDAPEGRRAAAVGAGVRNGPRRPGSTSAARTPGILPTPGVARRPRQARAPVRARHRPVQGQAAITPSCGIADGRPWSVGDNENLAVGQGDLEATPLQLAVAYSAIENGGKVVRPTSGSRSTRRTARCCRRSIRRPSRHVHIAPQNLDAIRAGLHAAASQPGGTSADVFAGWPQSQYPVYGKTGTAQHPGQADQSWYVCFVPDPTSARSSSS